MRAVTVNGRFPNLKTLSLSQCTSLRLISVAAGSPNIATLDVSGPESLPATSLPYPLDSPV